MGTARPGFWGTADHQAAKEFGRRFWKAFVFFRIVRRVWVPLAAVAFVVLAAGILAFTPAARLASEIRLPEIPDWGFWVAGLAILFGLSFFVRPVRWFWVDLRYRILP